jgi:hypothetical protein
MSKFEYHLDKITFPGAGEIIRKQGIEALQSELNKRGVRRKEVTITTEQLEGSTQDNELVAKAFAELLDAIGAHQGELDGLKQADEARIKARKDADEAADKRIKALEDDKVALAKRLDDAEKALKAIKEDTPRRASDASETKLTEAEEKEAKEKIEKRTVEFDPAFPGMNVPLKQS